MFCKAVSLALVAVLLHGSIAAQTEPQSLSQTAAEIKQVLHKAQMKDKAVKVTLNKKIDNQNKFTGKVSEISDTGFTLTNQQTGVTTKLGYADVGQVKQKGMSKSSKILIVGLVVVGAAIGIGFAAACSAEGGPHC